MTKIKKVYVVGNQYKYTNFINNYSLVNNIEEADIIIFTGGEDVDPSLYNCKKHFTTYSNIDRDNAEIKEFKKIKNNQLVIAICRGAQLMCVINGGKLIQDVSNHSISYTHQIIEFSTDKIYDITSTHHQMQYPFNIPKDYWTCLFASNNIHSLKYLGDGIEPPEYEPEIVLYHTPNKPKCLAIQGHPEYMNHKSQIVIRLNEIINNLLNNED
ncbi:MAG: gamma-glutamyl-gamma-aminobutyrate hydrolase family protein [Romboutsia sp.]